MSDDRAFGDGDASFQAAGQEAGLGALVESFYDHMSTLPAAATILKMHNDDLSLSREKLKVFLTGWLGGPKLYAQKFQPIGIPRVHAHLDIGEGERDAWMLCMKHAVAEQSWSADFKAYFLSAIFVPAERVRKVCTARIEANKG